MGKTLMFLNPRKRSRKGRRRSTRRRSNRMMKMNPRKARRSGGRRRRGGSRGMSSRNIMGSVKAAFSKDIVMTGLGLFMTQTVASVVWAKYGPKKTGQKDSAGNDTYTSTLPLATSSIGGLLYGIGIPVAVGMLTRKFSPAISNGAYLAGVSGLINQYIGPTVKTEVAKLAGTSAYITRGSLAVPAMGRIPGPRNHTAVDSFSNFPGQRAIFPQNGWARR